MIIVTLFTIAKVWKQPKCSSVDKWIKRCGAYTMECRGPASAESRDALRMDGVGERNERMTPGDQALVSEAHNFIFKRSFYTLTCT